MNLCCPDPGSCIFAFRWLDTVSIRPRRGAFIRDPANAGRVTIVPENDPADLAERFLGIKNISLTVPPHGPYNVGDHHTFTVLDSTENVTYKTDCILAYKSDLLYFWVEAGVTYNQADLETLAQTFEDKIVPTDRSFFGDEWIPGIDNDPHIYIVYTSNIGSQAAGVFVSDDEVNPLAEPNSNAAELFMVNASNTILGQPRCLQRVGT